MSYDDLVILTEHQASMATTLLSNGMEVPSVNGGVSNTNVYSSQTRTLDIPNFDEDDYEDWAIYQLASGMMAEYEKKMGIVFNRHGRKMMIARLEVEAHKIVCAPKKKRKNKCVSFFTDVPYKHDEKTGQIFKGPISSQKTYDTTLSI